MSTPLLILGNGSFAIEALDIAEAAGGFRTLGFVTSVNRPAPGERHAGLPVSWIDDLVQTPSECLVIGAMVSTRRRPFLETMAARGFGFATLVHPSAVISPRATVRDGCIIHAGVVVSSNTTIGPHAILNRGCLIGHDNEIGSFVTIGPGANLAGGTVIGAGAYVGVGAVVRDHLSIGSEAVVGAGAVVVKPVEPNTLVMGMPARVAQTGVHGY